MRARDGTYAMRTLDVDVRVPSAAKERERARERERGREREGTYAVGTFGRDVVVAAA